MSWSTSRFDGNRAELEQGISLNNQRDMMTKKTILNFGLIVSMTIGCLLLSGCASDGHMITIPEAIANKNWTGHPINEAIGKWGKPLVTPVGDGTTHYEWGMGGNYAHTVYTPSVNSNMFGDMMTSTREQKVVTSQCTLIITADSNGIITNFATTHTKEGTSGCGNFYFDSGSISPDAESAAKGKMLVENMGKAKELKDRYGMVCANPQYAVLFRDMHCDDPEPFTVAPDVKIAKITPQQQDLFLKWRADMDSIVIAYQGFLRGTQNPVDKAVADAVDTNNAKLKSLYEKSKIPFGNEHITGRTAQVLSAYVNQHYLQ